MALCVHQLGARKAALAVAIVALVLTASRQAAAQKVQRQPERTAAASRPTKPPVAPPAAAEAKPSTALAIAESTDLLAGLPPYLPKAPVKGEIKLAGSSAMNQLALLWAAGLRNVHPDVKVDVDMYESGQVLARLGKGEMQVGLMSRPLTEKELASSSVVALPTAKDVLGVVVHPRNPLEFLTLEQGMKILADPAAKAPAGAKTWGELGVKGEWAKLPIKLYGRSSGTGAWGYLTNRFLGDGAATRAGTDCGGYAEICKLVAADKSGVGYLSLSLSPPNPQKVLPLALNTGEIVPPPAYGEPVDPRYPLVRQLYVVLRWNEGEPQPPMVEELLRYVLSRAGQEDAIKAGFLPLRRDEVLASRDQLGWTGAR
jgi:phosphate transport system substrate-binding protein